MGPSPLSKSRFKLAIECPTKLHYAKRENGYRNKNEDNDFLEALADGGHQVRPRTARNPCGGASGQTGSRRHRGITGPPSGRTGANYADGSRKCSLMRAHSHSASGGDNPHPNRFRSTCCSNCRSRDSSGRPLSCLLCSA